jgi:hypothetical protein
VIVSGMRNAREESMPTDPTDITGEPPEETERRIIALGFDGDAGRYHQFVEQIRASVPPEVDVILRGSAVSGERWADGAPFDADGPGTSDLDLTFIGGPMLEVFEKFYIPGLHTAPLCDEDPDIAPDLLPLRQRLCALAGRPVNMQATSDLVQFVRDVTMRQPYFVLIEKQEAGDAAAAPSPDDSPSAAE